MDARVEWLIWQNGTDGRLERLPLLREASAPKVLLYEAQNDGMIDFEEVKKTPRECIHGCGPGSLKPKDREPDGDVGIDPANLHARDEGQKLPLHHVQGGQFENEVCPRHHPHHDPQEGSQRDHHA